MVSLSGRVLARGWLLLRHLAELSGDWPYKYLTGPYKYLTSAHTKI